MNHPLRNHVVTLATQAYQAKSYEDFRILFHALDETGQILLLAAFILDATKALQRAHTRQCRG